MAENISGINLNKLTQENLKDKEITINKPDDFEDIFKHYNSSLTLDRDTNAFTFNFSEGSTTNKFIEDLSKKDNNNNNIIESEEFEKFYSDLCWGKYNKELYEALCKIAQVDDGATDETPAEEAQVDDGATDETPAEEAQVDDGATDEMSADETPAEEAQVDDGATDETPADETPVDDGATQALDNMTQKEKYLYLINSLGGTLHLENEDLSVDAILAAIQSLMDSIAIANLALITNQDNKYEEYANDIEEAINGNRGTLLGRIIGNNGDENISYQNIYNNCNDELKKQDEAAGLDNTLNKIEQNYGITADQLMGNCNSPNEAIYAAYMLTSKDGGKTCDYNNFMYQLNIKDPSQNNDNGKFINKLTDCDENASDGWHFWSGAKTDKAIANDGIVTLQELCITAEKAETMGLVNTGEKSGTYTVSFNYQVKYQTINANSYGYNYDPSYNYSSNTTDPSYIDDYTIMENNDGSKTLKINKDEYTIDKNNKATIEKEDSFLSNYHSWYKITEDKVYQAANGSEQYVEHNGIIYHATQNTDGTYEIGIPVFDPNASYGFYNIYEAFGQADNSKLDWIDTTDKMEYLGYKN